MSRALNIRRVAALVGAASVFLPFLHGASAFGQPAAEPVDHAVVGPAQAEIDITERLETVRAKFKLPALGAALFSGDKVLAIGATGLRAIGHDEKVTIDDLWHLGSCTKAMTATLIATMVEKGELSWDTTLEQGLPELAKEMDAGFKPVTLRQLVTMTAGVPQHLDLKDVSGEPTQQRVLVAKRCLSRPPVNTPGSTMLYSNSSFAIAGLIAEIKTGKAWESLIAERVFTPLEITHFGFGAPGAADSFLQPRGHLADDSPIHGDNPPAIGPAGTCHMAMRDWAKFLMAHVRSGESVPELLKPESFTTLHTPLLDGYAMGWATAQRPWGGNVLNHNGSNTLWLSVTWLSPDKKFGLLVCTNTAAHDAAQACDQVAQMLIALHAQQFQK